MDDRRKKAANFKDLRVWQSAYDLSIAIYKVTGNYPKAEQFALCSQMQRASVSVCSNIAEGFGRRSSKEKDQFYAMANGSLTELGTQILISEGVGYINERISNKLTKKCLDTHKTLAVLQRVNKQKGAGG